MLDKPTTDISPISILLGTPGSSPFAHLGCGGIALPPPKYEPDASQPRSRTSWINGIDVSHWQGDINWQAVANNGYAFAIVKARDTRSWILNSIRIGNRLEKARLIRGMYHAFSPHSDGAQQAQFFLAHAPLEIGDLPPVLSLYLLNGQQFSPLGRYPLWVSHYIQADAPHFPPEWMTWTLWQFTDRARVDGIKNVAPADYFQGTLADLRKFAGASVPPP